MPAALLVRFNPTSPWRPGSPTGARNSVQLPMGSDTLFAALTLAMRDLGWMEEWLAAARADAGSAVRLSSMFPFGGRHLFVAPPANLWPPEQTGRVRWESARFIPLTLIPALLRDEALSEDRWAADPVSGCLLPVEKFGLVTPPFRFARRMTAAVDRPGQSSGGAVEMACIQFAPGAGMWFVAQFADEDAAGQWRPRMESACRLLADAGIGGERSSGWGKSDVPVFEEIDLVNRFSGSSRRPDEGELGYWLLSLFSPSPADAVDWRRGNYRIAIRNGRMHGSGALKKSSRLVAEGSVLIAAEPPRGAVLDVAPDGAAHAVYRSGAAVAIPIPWRETHRLSWLGADRAATEPPPAPPAEPAAVAEELPPEIVTEAVAEPVPVEAEPIEEQVLQEAVAEPEPVESEPILESTEPEALPGAPGAEARPSKSQPDEPQAEEPPAGTPTPEPPREKPRVDEAAVHEPREVAQVERPPSEPSSVVTREETRPDETSIEELPTERRPSEPPPSSEPPREEPRLDETSVEEPSVELPLTKPSAELPREETGSDQISIEEPPSEPPPTEPAPSEPPVEEPGPEETPVEEPPTETPPVEPPSGPSAPVEEPGPEPPERKVGDDEEGPR